MILTSLKDPNSTEKRVALTPDDVKKYVKKGIQVIIPDGLGLSAGFSNEHYIKEGATIAASDDQIFKSRIFVCLQLPSKEILSKCPADSLIVALCSPHSSAELFLVAAQQKLNIVSLELVPRTSRAQSMDVLSSQANIAGYRAVLEAATHYCRFMPMMMTSAGAAKPAKLLVIGAGVAGLQAIATAKRLGTQVEAFDIRPEVKEQIQSLGAKVLDLGLEESGAGTGGYAKELSEEGKRKQQEALTEKIKNFDIVISTASIPGKKAPQLILEPAVRGMRRGSVIVDLAAASGGNCSLTQPDKVVDVEGTKIVGWTSWPSMVAYDASQFFSRNCFNLISLFLKSSETGCDLQFNLDDDIVAGSLVTLNGEVRWPPKKGN